MEAEGEGEGGAGGGMVAGRRVVPEGEAGRGSVEGEGGGDGGGETRERWATNEELGGKGGKFSLSARPPICRVSNFAECQSTGHSAIPWLIFSPTFCRVLLVGILGNG